LGSDKDRGLTTPRKIYCLLVEGVLYEDRCLWQLRKVINGSKACANCILRELEEIKAPTISKISDDVKDRFDTSAVPKKKRYHKRRSREKATQNKEAKRMYSTQELSELLGKSERSIQEYAKEGRIPAQRAGRSWCFPKEEIDRWLSEKKNGRPDMLSSEEEIEQPEFQKADFIYANKGEPEKEA
jgi:excisionase family DNA binding protein